MSVLVKGMEMPKTCGKCLFTTWCRERMYMEQRPNRCPLVQLPEKHGRLIDADNLMAELHETYLYNGDARTVIYGMIEGQHAVIEAEGE